MSHGTFGFGVVGLGDMGRQHIRHFSQLPDFELRAVADVDEAKGQEYADPLGMVHITTNYQEVVSHPEVDVVIIAVPTAFHAEIALAAARNRKHIFCEKPIALTLADAKRMIQAAEEAGVKLAINFQLRSHEGFHILRNYFQDGSLERPVFYIVHMAAQVRPKLAMHDDALNRGPIVDVMCHTVDLWRHLFESEPARVYARAAKFAEGKLWVADVKSLAIDTAVVVVEFESGDVGTFHVTWGLPDGTSSFYSHLAYAPNALIEITPFSRISIQLDGRPPAVHEEIPNSALQENVRRFAAAVRGEGPVLCTGEDGLAALKVSLAALESAATGRVVEIAAIT